MKQFFLLPLTFLSLQVAAQNIGIGTTTPQNKLEVIGTVRITDSLGIGVTKPLAPLQFANTLANRKLVLFDGTGGNHDFYGLGVNSNLLRYQSQGAHAFYSPLSPIASKELLRLNADGRVGVGIANPVSQLSNTALNVVGIDGRGIGNNSFTWVADQPGYAAAVFNNGMGGVYNGLAVKIRTTEADQRIFDLSAGAVANGLGTSVMTVTGRGLVGISNANPAYRLDVTGDSRIVGDFIHTGNGFNGTWLYLTNSHGVSTGWKFITSPSPTTNTGGELSFYNNTNTSMLTLEQNGKTTVGGTLTAANLVTPGNLVVDGSIKMGLFHHSFGYDLLGPGSTERVCDCPPNTKVIGGGGGATNYNNIDQRHIKVNSSGPLPNGTGWRLLVTNETTKPIHVTVWAICARVQ